MRPLHLVLVLAALPPAAARAQAPPQTLQGTLGKIKDTGVVTIGTRDSSVPFSYLDDKQQPVGFSIDVCMKVVDAIKARIGAPGLKVAFQSVTGSTRIPLLANGAIDMECGSTTNNAERQRQVAFSNTLFLTASKFVAKAGSGLRGIEDLRGKPVASASGTTNIAQLTAANAARNLGLTILPARDHAEAFLLMETGRAAACVMDDVLLASFIASSKDPAAYAISGDAFSQPEPYAIMIRKDDPQFKAVVDQATADLLRSTEGQALYARWFMQAIPPRGLNLNLPMPPALARAFQDPADSPDPSHYGP